MKKICRLKIHSLRKERNEHIVERLKNGDSLSSFNSQASWFPPRPLVQKDLIALKRLYGDVKSASISAHQSSTDIDVQTGDIIDLQKGS